MLSRGGLELNEIWYRQSRLVEADVRLRSMERRAKESGSHDDEARYARELIRLGRHNEVDRVLRDDNPHRKEIVEHLHKTGLHDEADKVHLGPHARRFAEASRRLHAARRDAHKHWQTNPSFHDPESDKVEERQDHAQGEMAKARDNYHARVGEALRERGKDNPTTKASTASGRYRVLMAHGAKHLPRSEHWGHEHSLLMHHHGGTPFNTDPEPRDTGGGTFESGAQRHSFIHSLVSRHPNIRVSHATDADTGNHHVFVHLEQRKTTPVHHEGGSVRDHDTNSTVTGENYLASHPPHRDTY